VPLYYLQTWISIDFELLRIFESLFCMIIRTKIYKVTNRFKKVVILSKLSLGIRLTTSL
jgi:hypothetical protein